MADGATTSLGLVLPEPGASEDTWGDKTNANWQDVDDLFHESTGHGHTGVAGDGTPLTPPALEGVTVPGFVVNVDDAVFIARTIDAATNGGMAVADGDGVSGDPQLSVSPNNATALTTVADDDLFLLADVSDSNNLFKATRENILKLAKITSPRMAFNAEGSLTGAKSINLSLYSWFAGTSVGNTTWTFSNPPASGVGFGFILELTNGGAFTQTWPSSVDWPNGVAPSLSPSGVDMLVFTTRDGGTTWRGALVMQDSR